MKLINSCIFLSLLSPILLSHTNLGRFILNKKRLNGYLGPLCLKWFGMCKGIGIFALNTNIKNHVFKAHYC